ncbi:hypothetical protein CHS0354_035253 [Potamilus streckersoni]|uniref:MotA/TolQ/ExbB proton channel domain-containing protein n=1 Tax=Potamilus streckersoni TaxID=2493646 RepID=A0AAE0S2N2_9BIVA|nr:hypothetical protein CHS0354_035253 [Potamilus streckersoni]
MTSIQLLIDKGGIVMYPLFFLSVCAVYLISRAFYIYRRGFVFPAVSRNNWKDHIQSKKDAGDSMGVPVEKSYGDIILSTLMKSKYRDNLSDCIEEELTKLRFRCESILDYIENIASIAPLFGLGGTVLGIIRIFEGRATDIGALPLFHREFLRRYLLPLPGCLLRFPRDAGNSNAQRQDKKRRRLHMKKYLSQKRSSGINITPLIDILFVVVIFLLSGNGIFRDCRYQYYVAGRTNRRSSFRSKAQSVALESVKNAEYRSLILPVIPVILLHILLLLPLPEIPSPVPERLNITLVPPAPPEDTTVITPAQKPEQKSEDSLRSEQVKRIFDNPRRNLDDQDTSLKITDKSLQDKPSDTLKNKSGQICGKQPGVE